MAAESEPLEANCIPVVTKKLKKDASDDFEGGQSQGPKEPNAKSSSTDDDEDEEEEEDLSAESDADE